MFLYTVGRLICHYEELISLTPALGDVEAKHLLMMSQTGITAMRIRARPTLNSDAVDCHRWYEVPASAQCCASLPGELAVSEGADREDMTV